MSLNRTPVAAVARPKSYQWDVPLSALERWESAPQAAEADDPNTISIFDVIGEDYWSGGGFTAKRAAAALRSIGKNPVTVNVNSPGGDMFEGLAIYNLLASHPGEVTVNVMGYAASAASIIAMAGDRVIMSTGSMMMIHRAWGLAVGNTHDFTDAATLFQSFDSSMADIYAARTGLAQDVVLSLLDGPSKASDGTWLSADEAIEKGFADEKGAGTAKPDAKAELPAHIAAMRRIDRALAAAGETRRSRTQLLHEIRGERDAAENATRDAGKTGAKDMTGIKAALVSTTNILSKG